MGNDQINIELRLSSAKSSTAETVRFHVAREFYFWMKLAAHRALREKYSSQTVLSHVFHRV